MKRLHSPPLFTRLRLNITTGTLIMVYIMYLYTSCNHEDDTLIMWGKNAKSRKRVYSIYKSLTQNEGLVLQIFASSAVYLSGTLAWSIIREKVTWVALFTFFTVLAAALPYPQTDLLKGFLLFILNSFVSQTRGKCGFWGFTRHREHSKSHRFPQDSLIAMKVIFCCHNCI